MPEKKRTDTEEDEREGEGASAAPPSAPKVAPARYKVLSSGLTGAGSAHYAGEVVTAEQLGDDARIAKLLARNSIEAV